jgi:type IV pilus assembly protein PilX
VLLILVVATVLGVGAAQVSLVNERSARNDRDTEVAFQAAEAALVDAETDVLGPNDDTRQRLCLFAAGTRRGFRRRMRWHGEQQGLCAPAEPGADPAWMTVDFRRERQVGRLRHLHGPALLQRRCRHGHASRRVARPRTALHRGSRSHRGGWQADALQSASARDANYLFRVTAIGYGMRDETQVVLQTNLYKPAASPGCLPQD